jgi:hypothetical protein
MEEGALDGRNKSVHRAASQSKKPHVDSPIEDNMQPTSNTRGPLPEMDAEEIENRLARQVRLLIDFTAINEPTECPPAPTFEDQVEMARCFRESLQHSCTRSVCAVCSIPQSDVHPFTIETLPHSRHAHTTTTLNGTKYCLQPAGVKENMVDVCSSCLHFLKNKKIPKESLVCIDPGSIPRNPNPKLDLAPLRLMEERLVARVRTTSKLVYLIKSAGKLPPDCQQQCSKGHIIGFPNVEPTELARTLLLPINEIPDQIQVVFLNIAANVEDLKKLAAKCKAIHVRGKEILKWAVYLSWVSGGSIALRLLIL